MRLYLVALDRNLVDRRRHLQVHVTPAFVREFLGLLQLSPHADMFPVHPSEVVGCPGCGGGMTFVEVSLSDRARHACSHCKTRWLTLHPRSDGR